MQSGACFNHGFYFSTEGRGVSGPGLGEGGTVGAGAGLVAIFVSLAIFAAGVRLDFWVLGRSDLERVKFFES